ncbi:MAG: hypothetical protein GQ570_10890 [Helicobacteraceae bacterium]|nr:hypothetical protein [Helicobacteraceae bacterium]
MTANISYEKVSFNLPSDIKSEVVKLKETMHVSLNTIYKTAISEYVQRQEVKRWEDAAKLASKDNEYQKLSKELSETEEDFYEY